MEIPINDNLGDGQGNNQPNECDIYVTRSSCGDGDGSGHGFGGFGWGRGSGSGSGHGFKYCADEFSCGDGDGMGNYDYLKEKY